MRSSSNLAGHFFSPGIRFESKPKKHGDALHPNAISHAYRLLTHGHFKHKVDDSRAVVADFY